MISIVVSSIKYIAWIISIILIIYALHFTIISIFSFFPQKKKQSFQPKYKFAAVIAARNEELVIGNLIKSLELQSYPPNLLDIIVIPNNCTDHTKEVSLRNGAKIFDCKGVIKCKGDALEEFFDHILKINADYDAFCIFDADNVVHNNFIAEMNNAICRGTKIGQGYRDSKNPRDTIISSCYSIYYYMVNRFHNRARSVLNLSAMVNGSGFMVSKDIIQKQGGWHTKTLTEDIEFTTQCILNGDKVEWIPDAIIFDEQPLTFAESWNQRKRWSTGVIQCMEIYVPSLFRNFAKAKEFSNFDMIMFFISPIMQTLYFVFVIIIGILNMFYIEYNYFSQTELFYKLSIDYSYLINFAIALLVVLIEKKHKMLKGIITFWFFIISWIPINMICLFKKQTEWIQIKHTRVITIDEISCENHRIPMKRKKRQPIEL